MYLHLGHDTVIKLRDIIGIFDLDKSTISKQTRDFLSRAERNEQVINVTSELPKSFVLCNKDNKYVVYISQISTTTLLKRTKYFDEIANI